MECNRALPPKMSVEPLTALHYMAKDFVDVIKIMDIKTGRS